MSEISNLAYVHPEAKLGQNVVIEAFAFIDKDVEIGDNCIIHPYACLRAGARLGNGNEVFENAIIAATPQDFRWKGERSYVIIGDNNKIREHVIINRSISPEGITRVGNNSFIMAQSHIGHDSSIGDYCVLGNGVKIAGDVNIGDNTILSSGALVHESCDVGEWVLVKGGCRVNSNVPPFAIMAHNPITYSGVNAFILERAGRSKDTIDEIAKSYRHLYLSNTSAYNALKRIEVDIEDIPEKQLIIDFIKSHRLHLAALPKIEEK